MTASERLRELDGAMQPWEPPPPEIQNMPYAPAAAYRVLAALPLIADVVEAAEAFVLPKPERGCHCATCALARALTALRDALEKK